MISIRHHLCLQYKTCCHVEKLAVEARIQPVESGLLASGIDVSPLEQRRILAIGGFIPANYEYSLSTRTYDKERHDALFHVPSHDCCLFNAVYCTILQYHFSRRADDSSAAARRNRSQHEIV